MAKGTQACWPESMRDYSPFTPPYTPDPDMQSQWPTLIPSHLFSTNWILVWSARCCPPGITPNSPPSLLLTTATRCTQVYTPWLFILLVVGVPEFQKSESKPWVWCRCNGSDTFPLNIWLSQEDAVTVTKICRNLGALLTGNCHFLSSVYFQNVWNNQKVVVGINYIR